MMCWLRSGHDGLDVVWRAGMASCVFCSSSVGMYHIPYQGTPSATGKSGFFPVRRKQQPLVLVIESLGLVMLRDVVLSERKLLPCLTSADMLQPAAPIPSRMNFAPCARSYSYFFHARHTRQQLLVAASRPSFLHTMFDEKSLLSI